MIQTKIFVKNTKMFKQIHAYINAYSNVLTKMKIKMKGRGLVVGVEVEVMFILSLNIKTP